MNINDKFVLEYGSLIADRVRKEAPHSADHDGLVSKVYERLLSHFTYDEERGTFTTWLGWVVKSVVSNEMKRLSRSTDALDHSVDLEAASNVIGAEDAGLAIDELNRLMTSVKVNPLHMKMFRDYHLQDLTRKELVERYDLPEETVKSILARVMKALRDQAAG